MLRFLSIVIVSILLSGCCSPSYIEYRPAVSAKQHKIKWQKYSKSALVAAKAAKKPVFLYFKLANCGPCDKLESETFLDPEVVTMVNYDFMPVVVFESNSDMHIKHEVMFFPTILVLDSVEQKEVSRIIGFKDSDTLKPLLQLIILLERITK
jgi:thioredoxin-related protein